MSIRPGKAATTGEDVLVSRTDSERFVSTMVLSVGKESPARGLNHHRMYSC